MTIKFFAAPSNLVAVFELEDRTHTHNVRSCPVVALTQTEFGELSAMCAVQGHEYFVPVEKVPALLHDVHGGLYRFDHYGFLNADQKDTLSPLSELPVGRVAGG